MQITGIALQGLTEAQGRLEQAARRIAGGAAGAAPGADTVELSREITALLVARESFEANAALIQTVADIEGHLLDVLA
jgi:flagellar hook protein FlgE